MSKFGPNYSKFAIPNGRGIHPGSVRYHGISKQYGRLYRNEEVIESFNSEKWLIEDFCDFLQRLKIRKYYLYVDTQIQEFDTQIPEFDTQISEFDTQISEFDTWIRQESKLAPLSNI